MVNGKRNYEEWSKEELIREIHALKKQKTYGLVWEREKIKEDFDLFINWEGEKTKEEFTSESKNKFPVLAEVKDKEIITDKEKPVNLLIEGDNYHSLAVLNFTHKGKIDVIYIDPPYNTGNKDFKYNDKFVDREDGYRHSKWLSFMSKRLALAKNLLKETGVIFISIDTNEFSQLKILCDEVFGEKSFICDFIWKKRSGGGYTNTLVNYSHEYILSYAKNITKVRFNDKTKDESQISIRYKFKDNKGVYKRRDLRKSGSADLRTDRPTMYYPVNAPDGSKIFPKRPDGREGRWSYSESTFKELLENGEVEFVKNNHKWKVYTKERPYNEDGELKQEKYESLLQEIALNTQGTNELKKIFPENDTIFGNPKPVNLIQHLLTISSSRESLILDFFAGSGTTGQAILEMNRNDGGNRQFILSTNDENKICTEVCYPRIRRVISGYIDANKNKTFGLGGNLKYFKTDFVESTPTDKNKRKLVDKCTEMLCIKEGAFEKVKDARRFKLFKNNERHLGIIFDDEYIQDFVKEAEKVNGRINVYVFSHDDSVPTKDFKRIKDRVTLKPIPETILKVYRVVFKDDV